MSFICFGRRRCVNLLLVCTICKSTKQQRIPVRPFLDKVSISDSDVEANLSTTFQQVRGTKQYWFQKSSDLKCMVQ